MILRQDVENLGNMGMEVQVKAGYARNFLYPKRKAVYATPANIVQYKTQEEDEEKIANLLMIEDIITKVQTSKLDIGLGNQAIG